MKDRTKLLFLTCLLICVLSIIFVGCTNNSFDVTTFEIDGPIQICAGEFNASDYKLFVHFKDGSSDEVILCDYMISDSDLSNLNNVGTYNIGIEYHNHVENFSIEVIPKDFENIKFKDVTYVYDGKFHSIKVENIPDNTKVIYSNENNYCNIGSYEIQATLSNPNYNTITMTAVLTINPKLDSDYFKGNIFQIVNEDMAKNPVSTGTGFVFDNAGWFVTNYHVMEGAYFSVGIFNIENMEKYESFTKLSIEQIVYANKEKDICVGKLEGYSKIASNYKDINLTTNYENGDEVYSVGYPNSSVEMMINGGEILLDLSSVADKLYSGVKYIGFNSYIAPGSSGGILVNAKGDVLGMTTLGLTDKETGEFILGAAISAFNYQNILIESKSQVPKTLIEVMHPKTISYIKLFNTACEHYENNSSENEKIYKEIDEKTGVVTYTIEMKNESVNDKNESLLTEESLIISSDYKVIYSFSSYWSGGDKRYESLEGKFSGENQIENFEYYFSYYWPNKTGYTIHSYNINYSDNLDLTLKNYYIENKGITATNENILYTKRCFNILYSSLYNYLCGEFPN